MAHRDDPLRADFSDHVVEEIAGLRSDAEREAYFSGRPAPEQLALVDFLCDQTNRLLRADIRAAESVVDSVGWLARRSGSDAAMGRYLRATGNLLFGRRDYRAALEQYEAALELLRADGNDREVARTLSNGLVLLTHLGEHERRAIWSEEARTLCDSLGDGLLRARLEFNLGHALALQDRYSDALDKFRAAHRYFLDSGEATDVAAALRNIAVAHQMLFNIEAALLAYEEAADFCRRHGLVHLLLEVDYNRAYIYFLRGEYERSIRLFDEIRDHCADAEDWHHKALCDLDQAEIFLEVNLIEEAATMARSAFEQFEELGMPFEATQALTYQALAANRSGSPDRALQLLEQARARFENQGNRFRTGSVDILRAQILQERGHYREAIYLATSAHAVFGELGIASRVAVCELVLASLALAHYDHGGAQSWCDSALEKLEGRSTPSLEYRAHLLKATAIEAQGDLDTALESYRRAYETLELIRGNLHADDLKIGFSNDQQAVYESLIAILLSQGHAEQRASAFELVQKAKSRSLSDLLATRLQDLTPARAVDLGLATEIRDLRAKANWYQRQIDLEQSRGELRSPETLAALRKAGRSTEAGLLRRLRRLQMADPQLSSLQGSSVTDLDSLRSRLPEGTQLLEYFIARGVLFVFLLDSKRFIVRRLRHTSELEADYQLLRSQIGKLASGYVPTQELREHNLQTTQKLLARLYKSLIDPVSAELDGRHLVIAPHDFLHHLPFHALRSGDRYLVDDFSISYTPSGAVLHLCSIRELERGHGALVLGVPDRKAPLIETEAKTVSSILPDSRLFLGTDASYDNLMRFAPDCRILHVATHGLFRRDNPMFSAIRLGTSRLSVFDLFNLELRADLVVLSGCSTGLSSVQGSDELIGLTRGLLYAGARSVLVSLWDVNDDSTNRFMATFYRHLSAEPSPARALARTQKDLRKRHPHPYHWSPFILVGSL